MIDEQKLRELWADNSLRTREVAVLLGTTLTPLYREAKRLKLPKREGGKRMAGELDPTPEEIEARSAEIRASWTRSQVRNRTPAHRWRPPVYHTDTGGLVIQS